MSKRIILILFILSTTIFIGKPVLAAANDPSPAPNSQTIRVSRLSGLTRYATAKVISENYNKDMVKNVILVTGNNYADALSASVIAHEKEAPILLVDSSVEGSGDAFDYIFEHLYSLGTVYIIGGTGIIGPEFETKIKDLGFNNIVRIAGTDRYETSCAIADSLKNSTVSTVVISSGEQYPDALSISGFAAKQGWPILLSPHDSLPPEIEKYLQVKKPLKVYISGGAGVISDNVQSEISSLLPQADIERLAGQSRFDTNVIIAETFRPNPSTVYLTTGYGFADALAGSVLAAKNGDPIVFIDPSIPTLPKSTAAYFAEFYAGKSSPSIVTLGGSGVVSDNIIESIRDLISGKVKVTDIYAINDLTVTVTQNESYSLPKTVPARLYNSDTINVPVQWNPRTVDTAGIGSSIYEGVVEGYSQVIKLNLTVHEPVPVLIAQYSTQFDENQVNRSENIRLAAKALDGKVLAPGERFSFNNSVGERTAEAGYKEAMIIVGDAYEPGLGGGVCQVSSTLYNAVEIANLQILERHAHSLPVVYVPSGQDATVSYPILDFRFKNNTDSNILIRSYVEEGTLTFKLYRKA